MCRLATEKPLFSAALTPPFITPPSITPLPAADDIDERPCFSGERESEQDGLELAASGEVDVVEDEARPSPAPLCGLPSVPAGEAFEALYRRHYRRVYALCLRMTGNPDDAEDLTQEVFLQVLRKLDSFRGEAAFTTWLHRVAVNQVLMHFRKKSNRVESVTEEGDMPEEVTPALIRQSQTPLVDKLTLLSAVRKLPRGYRTVLILHDVKGYEHEEIGRLLGISAGTSKSQLHKARARMQELLVGTRAA